MTEKRPFCILQAIADIEAHRVRAKIDSGSPPLFGS